MIGITSRLVRSRDAGGRPTRLQPPAGGASWNVRGRSAAITSTQSARDALPAVGSPVPAVTALRLPQSTLTLPISDSAASIASPTVHVTATSRITTTTTRATDCGGLSAMSAGQRTATGWRGTPTTRPSLDSGQQNATSSAVSDSATRQPPPAGEYGTREWLERCLFDRLHEPLICPSCYPAPYHDHKRIVAYRHRCQVCGGTGVVWQPVDDAEVEAALERFGS